MINKKKLEEFADEFTINWTSFGKRLDAKKDLINSINKIDRSESEVNVEAVVRLPKIEIDKDALRFTFINGDGTNLFWEDLFVGKRHIDFRVEVMRNLLKLYNECVENNIEPNLGEDEAT